jgi:hypothetical protein
MRSIIIYIIRRNRLPCTVLYISVIYYYNSLIYRLLVLTILDLCVSAASSAYAHVPTPVTGHASSRYRNLWSIERLLDMCALCR